MQKQPNHTTRRSGARSHRQGRDWPLDPAIDPVIEPASTERRCDHPECTETGIHRAPRARDALNSYYWFCLDHVRDYNKAWNYYANMSEAEVESERRKDTFWHRPTWPLGRKGEFIAEMRDPFDLFGGAFGQKGDKDESKAAFRENAPELAALATMDLKPPVTIQALKAKYKFLVKMYHPDANGGDKQAEERLKEINQAYATLTRSLGT